MSQVSFKEVSWEQIANDVAAVNPVFAKIINELDPPEKLRLYVGDYPYGHQIVRSGKFYINIKNKDLPIDHADVPKKIQDDLSYNALSNPVSLVLEKSIELYLDEPTVEAPMSPLMYVSEGSVTSTTLVLSKNSLHPPFLWNISSGARSLFMLPKISHAKMYRKLCSELGINVEPPNSSYDHYKVFKEIAKHEKKAPWKSKILYFSREWFQYLEDPKWMQFKNYLLESFCKSYDYIGNLFVWDLILNLILKKRKIKPSLYINNVVKHLFQIGIGFSFGLAPAEDETKGPIKFLQKVFMENYELKDYLPTIMQPTRFSMEAHSQPVYYSLQNPSLLDTPKKRDNSSQISDLYDIYSLFNKYVDSLKNEKLNITDTRVHKFAKDIKVNAIHTSPERYTQLSSSEIVPQDDQRFLKCLYPTKNKIPAVNNPFFRGCFRFIFEK